MKNKIEELRDIAKKNINEANNLSLLEELRVKYLGKKGELTEILKSMGSVSAEERPIIGQVVNDTRNTLEKLIETKQNILEEAELQKKLESELIDVTLPSKKSEIGHKHPLSQVIEDISDIFISMGYKIKEGPEIEKSYLNFDSLNVPVDHPSRDIQDTFYVTDDLILRSQTSTVQVRTMLENKPPLRVICPGRVYRSDAVDATHSPMFHQLEGLVVDKDISMADLKGTLDIFCKSYFGEKTKIRLRPHFFPFTEPSAEVDVTCFVCNGSGCRVCKGEGWIEILGAGMVHPNVLKAGGIDPNEYSGFAFGMGIDRIAMIKYGIDDMRVLFENDIRFLKQF